MCTSDKNNVKLAFKFHFYRLLIILYFKNHEKLVKPLKKWEVNERGGEIIYKLTTILSKILKNLSNAKKKSSTK